MKPCIKELLDEAKRARETAASVGYNPPAEVSQEVFEHAQQSIADIEVHLRPHNNQQHVDRFVTMVLRAYPFGMTDSKIEQDAKLEAYGAALSDLPLWAIEKSYGNIVNECDKAPSPKQMREFAERHTLKYRWALYDLKRLKVGE